METELADYLYELADPNFRSFQCKLMPTVDPEAVIGVRVPDLRLLVKRFPVSKDLFLSQLPHTYYEENNLIGSIIRLSKRQLRVTASSRRKRCFYARYAEKNRASGRR